MGVTQHGKLTNKIKKVVFPLDLIMSAVLKQLSYLSLEKTQGNAVFGISLKCGQTEKCSIAVIVLQ